MAPLNKNTWLKSINWIQSAGINDKKYNPWVGSQLLGVRDQFLIFHPLILLWDLKRIQLFLTKVQSFNTYSLLLIDSRPEVKSALQLYLTQNNIPKDICHVLNFDFPGTLTNQYYISTQSNTSGIITSRQIVVFFDYFLNRQFYSESLIIPCVRFSLYSLQNLPTNMQYGLPSKSGLFLAVRLLLKLLLKPFVSSAVQINANNYSKLVSNFNKVLPGTNRGPRNVIHKSTPRTVVGINRPSNFGLSSIAGLGWKKVQEIFVLKSRLRALKLQVKKKLNKSKVNLHPSFQKFRSLKKGAKLPIKPFYTASTCLKNKTLSNIFCTALQQPLPNINSQSVNHFMTRASNILINKKVYLSLSSRKATKLRRKRFVRLKKAKKSLLIRNRGGIMKSRFSSYLGGNKKKRKVPSNLYMDAFYHYFIGSALLSNKKKHLLAKYQRTCNIKTQKDWLLVKQKQKLKIEKIKQAQYAKRQALRKSAHKQPTKNRQVGSHPFLVEKKARPVWQQGQQSPRNQGLLKTKSPRRQFSTKKWQKYKQSPANNQVLTKLPWVVSFVRGPSSCVWQYSFKHIALTSKFRFKWKYLKSFHEKKRYSALSPVTKNYGVSLISTELKKQNKLLNCLFLPKNAIKIPKVNFYTYRGLAACRWLYKQSRRQFRLHKFSNWRSIFLRVARKADRRWRQRKWKKAAVRQMKRSTQAIYSSRSLFQGGVYWRKLRMFKFVRPSNLRKWRSKYFRRYTHKEQFYLQFLYKPVVIMCRRPQVRRAPLMRVRPINSFKADYKVLNAAGRSKLVLKWQRRFNILGRDYRISHRFTKRRFFYRKRLLRRWLRRLPKWLAHRMSPKPPRRLLQRGLRGLKHQLLLTQRGYMPFNRTSLKKNYTNQLWFRCYRNIRSNTRDNSKVLSKQFRQIQRQKTTILKKTRLASSYWSDLTLKTLLKYKNATLWNWRMFKNRQRTVEEVKRFVQNFQHTSLKLNKHTALHVVVSKRLRQYNINKILSQYSKYSTLSRENTSAVLREFKLKPIKITKLKFLKFGGRLVPNKNILLGFNGNTLSHSSSFLQCYMNKRFWANDDFGPSPLVFWISPKTRKLKTPKQWSLPFSFLNYSLQLELPNYSSLSKASGVNVEGLVPLNTHLPAVRNSVQVKELNSTTQAKKTFKFIVSPRSLNSQRQDRWLWYVLKKKYNHPSTIWQQSLLAKKKVITPLRQHKMRKVFVTHNKTPKKVSNFINYLLRCNRRRRRRLRERTFKGPTRYRRKYRTHYMFNNLVRLNSQRQKYGKPDTSNHVNHYFIRKVVLRRFLRFIYGPKLTNRYFKHFSNLLFIKKFKFWTLYTFFYLRLDFVAILLKFALNLKWARHLIAHGRILVNNRKERASYSIFLGDVIRLSQAESLTEVDLLRNLQAFAPRVGSSPRYQTRLRIPAFFEYNRRIRAGTMFRLPWYYEVRGKLINKENLLLLARGPHSI